MAYLIWIRVVIYMLFLITGLSKVNNHPDVMLDQLWRGAAPRNEEQDKSNPPLEGWGLRKAVGRIMAAQPLSEPGWFLYLKG